MANNRLWLARWWPALAGLPVYRQAWIVVVSTLEWAWDWARYNLARAALRAALWLCPRGGIWNAVGWRLIAFSMWSGSDFWRDEAFAPGEYPGRPRP